MINIELKFNLIYLTNKTSLSVPIKSFLNLMLINTNSTYRFETHIL